MGMRKIITVVFLALSGCTYLSPSDQEEMMESVIDRLIPTGGELVRVITRKVPAPNNFTRSDAWAMGTEIIFSFEGRCFYAKRGFHRTPDQKLEVDC